tara:strand:+ start:851 stop:2305 length:1455 start_codon:yes stop_codon:yes gene_type:complete
MANNEIHQAGDYKLELAELVSYRVHNEENKTYRVDIKPILVNIELSENIMQNHMIGSLTVYDTQDIRTVLPITGLEKLLLKFNTPGMSGINAVEGEGFPFHVYKIDKINLNERQGKAQAYRIFFTAEEAFRDSMSRISKAYTGKIEDAVEDILRNKKFLNSKKKLFFEPSASNNKVVIPNLRPYEAINWMICQLKAEKYNGGGYFFYETPRGWFLRSLESMMAVNGVAARPVVWDYHYQTANVKNEGMKDVASDMHSVIKYEFIKPTNSLFNLRSGMYCSKLLIHDAFNKIFQELDFDYQKNFEKNFHTEHDNGQKSKNKFTIPMNKWEDTNKSFTENPDSQLSFQSGTSKIHNTMDTLGKVLSQEVLSQTLAMGSIQLKLLVPGNSLIQAGDMISFDLPLMRPLGQEKQLPNPYYTGRYLITAVKHSLSTVASQYNMVLECYKDAVHTPFELEIDNSTLDKPIYETHNIYDMDELLLKDTDNA